MSAPLRAAASRSKAETASSTATVVSLSERVRRLQAEARGAAREQVDLLAANLLQAHQLAEEIAEGGAAYPVGVRDLARRLSVDSAVRFAAIEAIMARA